MWQKLQPGKDRFLSGGMALLTMEGEEHWAMHEDSMLWFSYEI